jgi:peptidyl-prolyl cis-trans isomerase SurA
MFMLKRIAGPALVALALLAAPVAMPTAAGAAEVVAVVNGAPITSVDVQRRAAFLRLQQRKGNLQSAAREEMITQTLRMQEVKRLRINISDEQVNQAFANFAQQNKLSASQMEQVLAQGGVSGKHFKEYIRSQMAWGQALNARRRGAGTNSISDAVREMFKQGGPKPTTTEYVLEQVILVVPDRDRRSLLGKRKREAQELRARYSGCETSKQIAAGMIDVTIRPLGRVLEPELPAEWEKAVKATAAGKATAAQETPRGVEFIGVCSTRTANDDRVAELMVMQDQGKATEAAEALDKTYMEELRARARITNP